VADSPPYNGTFFYRRDSLLYRQMREALASKGDFLQEFKEKGVFLDDLVLYPINQFKDLNERNGHRRKGVLSLAQRMADYRPGAVVALMCAIEPMVVDAMRDADLSHVPLYVTPFPRPEHQKRFKEKLTEIVQKLPVTKPAD